jgi:hypothetical protein
LTACDALVRLHRHALRVHGGNGPHVANGDLRMMSVVPSCAALSVADSVIASVRLTGCPPSLAMRLVRLDGIACVTGGVLQMRQGVD